MEVQELIQNLRSDFVLPVQRFKKTSVHGTRSRYAHGCKCELCKAAAAAYMRTRRPKKIKLPKPPAPPRPAREPKPIKHGTRYGYSRGCRCEPCREACHNYNAALALKKGIVMRPFNSTPWKERKEELERLRFVEKWSIQKIGVYFGVSKQRISQILGNTGNMAENTLHVRGVSRNQKVKEICQTIGNHPNATNDELAQLYNVDYDIIVAARSGKRHYSENNQRGIGMKIEDEVSKILTDRGIKNTLTSDSRPTDIILSDGRTVEVRSRHQPSNNTKTKNFYFFPLRRNVKKSDFYILVVVRGNQHDYFVIPKCRLPKSMAVSFCLPQAKKSRGKYEQYHNRFDLLSPRSEER